MRASSMIFIVAASGMHHLNGDLNFGFDRRYPYLHFEVVIASNWCPVQYAYKWCGTVLHITAVSCLLLHRVNSCAVS